MKKITLLIILVWTTVACSDKPMVVNSRDAQFYNQFVNAAEGLPTAEKNMENLKLVQTGDDYAMRYALFDNQRFYYQIDRLGTGTGTWKYADGGLRLTASRTMFDIDIYLSAAKAEGNDLVFRFIDRHGFNSVQGRLREPQVPEEAPLKDFTESEKPI